MEQIAKSKNCGFFSAPEEVQNGYNLGNKRERQVRGMGEQRHRGKKGTRM